MVKEKLTIFVSSCDKYEDCCYPFFKLFSKFGGELKQCDIILNTESKKYTYDGLNIICPNNFMNEIPWGERFKRCLENVKTPYVLTFLDDFFLREDVDIERIKQVISWLDNDINIANFSFDNIGTKKYESKKYKDFCLLPIYQPWRCNTQSAIWRTSLLDRSMLYCENPWEYEQKGTIRNYTVMKRNKFFALSYKAKPIVNYGLSKEKDFSIVQGKWLKSDIEPLFKKENIDIDLSIRGFYEEKHYEYKEYCDSRNLITKIIAFLTRPIRNIKKVYVENHPKTDEQKKYYSLVTLPIKNYRKKVTNWDKIDYKKN